MVVRSTNRWNSGVLFLDWRLMVEDRKSDMRRIHLRLVLLLHPSHWQLYCDLTTIYVSKVQGYAHLLSNYRCLRMFDSDR